MITNMLPNNGIDLRTYDLTPRISTSYTWKLDPNQGRIAGYIDELEAVKQATYMILKTERGRYEIYPDWYGVELNELYGLSRDRVEMRLPVLIEEALSQDARISSIDDIYLEFEGSRCVCHVSATCIFGQYSVSVDYDNVA